MRRFSLLGSAVALALATTVLAAPVPVDPPTDEQIREWSNNIWAHYRTMAAEGEIDREAWNAYVADRMTELKYAELSASQLEIVSNFLTMAGDDTKQQFEARLTELSKQRNAEGAHAASLFVQIEMRKPGGVQTETVRTALTHPGLHDALAAGKVGGLMRSVEHLSDEVLDQVSAEIMAMVRALNVNTKPDVVASSVSLVTALNKTSVDKATRESLRMHVANLCTEVAEKIKDDPEQQRYADYLKRQATFVTGAFARGELIDHAAPEIEFTWYSGDQKVNLLSELKGKVVVLDFWATWCGPCIASFPNVRELQEHYHGYDVVILGVTSLQGRHYPGDGEPIDTEGNPEKEYELMTAFMKAKDMTWPVAFGKDDVFNPHYGVRGIPHVAIIGADGKVRHNGLHPAGPMLDKVEKIDALLKEAGLPAPAPPPAAVTPDTNSDG